MRRERSARLAKHMIKRETPPKFFEDKGEDTQESDWMTDRDNSSNDKKTGKRQTPKDLRVTGTFAEKTIVKRPPRPITVLEQHGNNVSMVDFGEKIGNVLSMGSLYISERKEMNRNKVGRPYEFSDSLIASILMTMVCFNMTFRIAAGYAKGIFEIFGVPTPSPSRLLERANQLMEGRCLRIDDDLMERYGGHILAICANDFVSPRVRRVGIDASGISMSSINAWRRKKWDTGPKDRGWLKIHVLCDVDSGEALAYAITDNEVGDAPLMKVLVKAALEKGHRFDVLYADNAYCTDENWIFLCRDLKKEFVTSFRSNTSPTSNGCFDRGQAAKLWCSLQYDEWVQVSGYGTRWKCECMFSDLKRIFPENLEVRSNNGIVRQMIIRMDNFNLYKRIRADNIGTTGNGVTISN